MLLERSLLEKLNKLMLGRGVPIEKDNMGYNKPDYVVLRRIYNGASYKDLYEISKRLQKYYNTQLDALKEELKIDFTLEDLKETEEYYKNLSKDEKSVTVEFIDDFRKVYVSFEFDWDFIDVVKKYSFKFDKELKVYVGDSYKIKKVLNELEKIGADVENAIKYIEEVEKTINKTFDIKENSKTKEENDEQKDIENENKIFIKVTEDGDYLKLNFPYDRDLVDKIKSLENRKFDWEDKSWKIFKYEVKNLIELIRNMQVDYSELEKYSDEIKLPVLNVEKVDEFDVKLSLPYIKRAVDLIKTLEFREYNKEDKSWLIDLRETEDLLNKFKEEKIEEILDITQLEKIVEEYKKEEEEYLELKDYSYLKRKPYKHQLEAGQFLLKRKRALLADEMGGGKTLSAILAGNVLDSPRLVICPASLKLNWKKEIKLVDSKAKVNIVTSKNKVDKNADWNIINYDLLDRYIDDLLNIEFNCLIVDECHYLKAINNSGKPNSIRAERGIQLAEKIKYVFLLTGTPITNRPKDLFNLLVMIKHPLSRNFHIYAHKYCGATFNGFGWNYNGSSNEEELHQYIKPYMLRRLKKDMLDLPEKTRQFIPVEIDLKEYQKELDKYIKERNKLKDKGEHLVYLNTMKHILAKQKVEHTIEIAQNILESGESVVIFTNYNIVVEKILEYFKDNATKITGDMKENERQKAVDEFQNRDKKIIVCNIVAGGVGITLTKASNLIFNDFDWIPANHFQAEDRIHRIGQTNKVVIKYIYAEGAEIDEKLANILEMKADMTNKIIDGGEGEYFNIDVVNTIINIFNKK